MNILTLINKVKEEILGFPHSRVHPLNNQPHPSFKLSIKRDDELSFGISGSKLRKYQSLLWHLLKIKAKNVALMGGPFSNHLLSCSQLLIENSLTPYLLLKGRKPLKRNGNFLLTSLFIPPSQMWWAEDEKEFSNLLETAKNQGYFIIQEGAFQKEALLGALTLPLDILRNEEDLGISFSHIFIEAGTGLMAMALIFLFALLKKKTHLHIVLLADTKEIFLQRLFSLYPVFRQIFSSPLEEIITNVSFYEPFTAKSFGATNQTLFKEIIKTARQEGFLTDPIYSAKLLHATKEIIKKRRLTGEGLFIHSGGALTLMGFQEPLNKTLEQF